MPPKIERVYMSADVQHPKWTEREEPVQDPLDLSFADVSATNAYIVKLDFSADGNSSSGNGFFVNTPKTSRKIILTAGHNLIGPSGNRTTNLVASYVVDNQKYTIHTKVEDYRLSAAYEGESRTATADWGAILVDLNMVQPKPPSFPPGFGYNIMLGQNKIKGSVYVTGYRASNPADGHPSTSSGQVDSHTTELRYKAQTEQGISGSVVWAGHRNLPIVLAVHNNRQSGNQPGGRGARVTFAMIREIYAWPGVLDPAAPQLVPSPEQKVRIKAYAKDAKVLPPTGLYLNFPEGSTYAGIKLGSGTVFNIIPAYVRSEAEVFYGFLADGKWMSFETLPRKEIVLEDAMRDTSLLMRKERGSMKANRIYVVAGQNSFQLQVECRRVDDEQEDAESSEAYLVEYPLKNLLQFTEFVFEKA